MDTTNITQDGPTHCQIQALEDSFQEFFGTLNRTRNTWRDLLGLLSRSQSTPKGWLRNKLLLVATAQPSVLGVLEGIMDELESDRPR